MIEDDAYEGRLISEFEKFESTVKALQAHIEDTRVVKVKFVSAITVYVCVLINVYA